MEKETAKTLIENFWGYCLRITYLLKVNLAIVYNSIQSAQYLQSLGIQDLSLFFERWIKYSKKGSSTVAKRITSLDTFNDISTTLTIRKCHLYSTLRLLGLRGRQKMTPVQQDFKISSPPPGTQPGSTDVCMLYGTYFKL